MTALGELTFHGKSMRDFHTYISGKGTYDSPEQDYELVSIPGKNGDLIFDQKRYKNVEVTYPAFIVKDFTSNYADLISFLLSSPGYHRLEDSYHSEIFRMAFFSGPVEPELTDRLKQGSFDLTFHCKPEKYLKSGEKAITFTSDGEVVNPTRFEAKPLIRVYGTGSLEIGNKTIKITKADEYTDLDCDIEEAYKDDGSHNCNGNVQITDYDFPTLPIGKTGIKLGEGITKVEVTPRWWTV